MPGLCKFSVGHIADYHYSHTYYVEHYYQPVDNNNLKYSIYSDAIVIPAYPQVASGSFKSSFDKNKGDIVLSWALNNAPSKDCVMDSFVISRSYVDDDDPARTSVNLPDTTVSYVKGTKNYTCNMALPQDVNRTYTFSIVRSATKGVAGWEVYKQSSSVTASTALRRPITLTSKLANDKRSIMVKWYNVGKTWVSGSTATLTRINQTSKTSEDITLTDSTLFMADSGSYKDEMVSMCNEYQYKLSLTPSSNQYKKPLAIYTDFAKNIIPSEIGEALDLTVSKGYYADRVQLNWSNNGTIDNYVIERKVADDSSSEYEKIASVAGSGTQSSYTYPDKDVLSGVLYSYRVYGVLSCSGKNLYADTLSGNGFRTATGDFYGKVTFDKSGQGVDSVKVSVETTDSVPSKSLSLPGYGKVIVGNADLLKSNTGAVALQAYVKQSSQVGDQQVIGKDGMYKLGLKNGFAYFAVANDTVMADKISSDSVFTHLSGVYTGSEIRLYINGELASQKATSAAVTGNSNQVVIGGNYKGNIDEVRIWGRALGTEEISSDFTRCLIGNEKNLLAYYTFDYSIDGAFFDASYSGTTYHRNDGTYSPEVSLSGVVPTRNQLWYRGITSADGVYAIRNVPYIGNGTAYSVVPVKGAHSFSPVSEVRFLSSTATNYTVNFVDNSSFEVSGTVTYSGGNYPVEGVYFSIDGTTVVNSDGSMNMTKSDGTFTINVPVGTHEVKAIKPGHTFDNGGHIVNSEGANLNYQDIMSGLTIIDQTRVKYIGRVAGGTRQEAFPVGHSLSTNNLANDIEVVLTHKKIGSYNMSSSSDTMTYSHFRPSNQKTAHVNKVIYGPDGVRISVNDTTGEFVAYVIPESYKVTVIAKGHDNIPGSGEDVDFSDVVTKDSIKIGYTYADSVYKQSTKSYIDTVYHDTVYCNKMQQFIKRYTPTLDIVQIGNDGKALPYFGMDSLSSSDLFGKVTTVGAYNAADSSYYFSAPVFEQDANYTFKATAYEEYKHSTTGKIEQVPTSDASINFTGKLSADSSSVTLKADSLGVVYYSFKVGEPSMTTASSSISAKMTYGSGKSLTSINWSCPFGNNVLVMGRHSKGADFVTAGPNHMLTVLRDPPGSNSYSYLEKGVTFNESSTYTGSVEEEGFEGANLVAGVQTKLFTGVGAGVITSASFTSTTKVGCAHSAQYQGSNVSKSSTTTTTRFQTSGDPAFVGADGDVYVGYSTNVAFSSADAVTLISQKEHRLNPSKYKVVYTDTSKNWMLAKGSAASVSQSFNTLYAYPQTYIEQTLIPSLQKSRNALLMQFAGADTAALRKKAIAKDTVFYLSYFAPGDADYGKSNSDKTISDTAHGKSGNITDGPSYLIIAKPVPAKGTFANAKDTINVINQWIDGWKGVMAANEQAKLEAIKDRSKTLIQNYSFHAGSPVEYSESYSTGREHSSTFHITVGVNVEHETSMETSQEVYAFTNFSLSEKVTTTHGGTFSSNVERSHCKGFVLSESGSDYLSVDVLHEPGYSAGSESYNNPISGGEVDTTNIQSMDSYSSFIFVTKGGATACPYEGAYVSKYYNPGEAISPATLQQEIPEIAIAKDFVNNVPSGEKAYFTLYLRNNSETQTDQWFNLRVVDGSNPDGAIMAVDGTPIGGGHLEYLVPAGQTLTKTLAVSKGRALNYDNLKLALTSQCQSDIADTVSFTAHFTPSCSNIAIVSPSNNWTYNTNCLTDSVKGKLKHYMPVKLSGFDVNYADFDHIELQYKASSASDNDWSKLMNYYDNDSLYAAAVANGLNALKIKASDAGVINYNFFMDDLPDKKYDLRAVVFCNINNQLVENESEVATGVKDMYNPRLFGQPLPANGVLTANDEIRINFNESIAEGYLTNNNFSVTGIRNGAKTDHSTSLSFDGGSSYLATAFDRNLANKDFTVEMWMKEDSAQNATLFSTGVEGNSLALSVSADHCLVVSQNGKNVVKSKPFTSDAGTWNNVALVFNKEGKATLYYNWDAVADAVPVNAFTAVGKVEFGRNLVSKDGYFKGQMHDMRIWTEARSIGDLKTNSLAVMSGNESNLYACYPLDEGKGSTLNDKSHSVNLTAHNCEWTLPKGYSSKFAGKGYLAMNSGSAVITKDNDFTLEFWFKADKAANTGKDVTLLCNGKGDGTDVGGSENKFNVGFDKTGALTLQANGYTQIVDGNYEDGAWHHFAYALSRTQGRAQIYMDGQLNSYFNSDLVGGIEGASIFAGARCYYNSTLVNTTADNYFSGYIDEVRLWKQNRPAQLIANYNNVKMDGSEMGLLLYYPFEHYITYNGISELKYTLDDTAHVKAGARLSASVVPAGSVVSSDVMAPVKDMGPVSQLNYTYVANNDAIIITLDEDADRIDKSIVTFTVDGVSDLNGNKMISPVSWSAYIDKNQLKWDESSLTQNVQAGSELEFTVPFSNAGGSNVSYRVDGLPAWLSVSSASGTLSPKSSDVMTFTIAEGTNVGSYEETVYLTNLTNNISEPLDLNIVVSGKEPDWNVNPSDYFYNMSVIGKMKFGNEYSADKRDKLAAFHNGVCVGVANSTYNADVDMWYTILTVYGNVARYDDLVFRMWDASTGKTYEATSADTIKFVNDAIYGTPVKPVVFVGDEVVVHDIDLAKAWNWISFNVAKTSTVQKMLGGNWTSADLIKNLDANASYSVKNMKWYGSLDTIVNTSMYMVKSKVAKTLSYSGVNANPADVLITAAAGKWSYISYIPDFNLPVKAALADYHATEGDVIKSINEFAVYYKNNWIGSLTYMRPGQGYLIKNVSSQTKTFHYPSDSVAQSGDLRSAVASAGYADNMSVVAVASKAKDDRLFAVVDGDEETEAVPLTVDGKEYLFISVGGDNSVSKVDFVLKRADGTVSKSSSSAFYCSNSVVGSIDQPFVIAFDKGLSDSLMVTPSLFHDEFSVERVCAEAGNVKLEVINAQGVVVDKAEQFVERASSLQYTFHTSSWVSGIYLLKVTTPSGVVVKNLIKK
jgi:hypothetical protein